MIARTPGASAHEEAEARPAWAPFRSLAGWLIVFVAPVAIAGVFSFVLLREAGTALDRDRQITNNAGRLLEIALRLEHDTENFAEGEHSDAGLIRSEITRFRAGLDSLTSSPWQVTAHSRDEAQRVDRSLAALRASWARLGPALGRIEANTDDADALRAVIAGLRPDVEQLRVVVEQLDQAVRAFQSEQEHDHLNQIAALIASGLLAQSIVIALLFAQVRRRQRNEAELERLSMVARHAASGILLADGAGRVLWVNDALLTLTGFGRPEVVGQPLAGVLRAESGADSATGFESALRGPADFRRELVLQRGDGQRRWMEVELVHARARSDGRDYQLAIMQDVHDRVQATRARAESERDLRIALQAMQDGLAFYDADGRIRLWNAAAEPYVGLLREGAERPATPEAKWRLCREDGTEFPASELPVAVTLATGAPQDAVILGLSRGSDATVRWLSICTNPVQVPSVARIAGVVVTISDVTARRAAERQLRNLERAVRQSPAMVVITDEQGRIEYVNDRFPEITGYRFEEVRGRNPKLLASGDTPHETFESMWTALAAGQGWEGRLHNRRRDGRKFLAQATIFPIRDERGQTTHYVSTEQDITEQVAREEELARAREAAQAALRAKSEFLQNISHELRTPMNGIQGMADLLLGTELSPPQRADLVILKRSADHLTTVIGQLFEFTRLESGNDRIESVAFRLRSLLHEVSGAAAQQAQARSLTYRNDVEEAIPDALLGDPGSLREVLRNLLDNAVRFTSEGQVELRVRRETGGEGRVRLRFEVRDTGVGIPADRQAAIFQAFEQADGSNTRKFGGVGLGLTIASQLVARRGGHLEVRSAPGVGSLFTFALEFGIDAPVALPLPAGDPPAPAAPGLEGRPVLVVQAAEASRLGLAEFLRRRGAQLATVESAEAAVDQLRQRHQQGTPAQVLVVDQRGAGLDAFDVVARVRAPLGDAVPPILIVSAHGQRGDAERCRELGVAAYLTGPVDDGSIEEALLRLLAPAEPSGALVTRHLLRESRPQLRVLLVDDNAVNRKVAGRLLERAGCLVIHAIHGRDAVDRFTAEPFDVVLMDVQMPEMDGLDATRAIRALERREGRRHTPIIAVTAHTLDSDRAAVHEAGMDEFVAKPIQGEELLQKIRRLAGTGVPPVAADAVPPALREVLNWEEVLDRMDGDEAVLYEVLHLFRQDAPNMLRRLEEARASGDAKAIERAAHGIKGASATISARAVAPLAREVEQRAREGRLNEAIDGVEDLRAEMDRLVRSLETLPERPQRAA